MRVLVVDDDPAFCKFTTVALEEAGFQYEVAVDGAEGLAALTNSAADHFDLVLLDVEMPGPSGWELLTEIREKGNEVPVIFVTAHEALQGRVKGLRMGADDYVIKPVEYEELIARLEAVLRRRRALPTITFGDLRMDLARRKVERSGRLLDLSPREYDLLMAIVEGDGEPVPRERLLREVWDMDFDPETNVVDVHVGRLRKKLNRLGPAMIETVRGQGYRALRQATP